MAPKLKIVDKLIEFMIGIAVIFYVYPYVSAWIGNFTGLGIVGGGLITIVPVIMILYWAYSQIKGSTGV